MAILADNYSNNSVIKVTELNNTEDKSKDISRTPDHVFYYKFSFNTYSKLFITKINYRYQLVYD